MGSRLEQSKSGVGTPQEVKKGATWRELYERCQTLAPEAFAPDRVLSLWGGEWHREGAPRQSRSPIDQSPTVTLSMLTADEAKVAVRAAAAGHREWGSVGLDERRRRVAACLSDMDAQRELLALLVTWEIGKPYRQATVSVDRTISGVQWYMETIGEMLEGRTPLRGPVSNIASWNYPLSVLMHALLVQVLAGNAVIAKIPTDGGGAALALSCAFARRAGLPVTLVAGAGADLSPALVESPELGCVSFVGGRESGAHVEAAVRKVGTRYILEEEGLNAWGVWDYSKWDELAAHLRKGFEYGKQRCTAYPRYVIQRNLFDEFLETYLEVVRSLTYGHPLAVASAADDAPDLDFGPLINARKARDLEQRVQEAIAGGAVPLYRGKLDDGWFLPGQDKSAYFAPVALLSPPLSSSLYRAEPFGPVDTVVLVDNEDQLVSAMNVSGGTLVASVAADDEALANRLAGQVQAFKVGINKPRSRGDREESFGGRGASWSGAFVGGAHLVRAVTQGPGEESLAGNFPDGERLPAS